MKRVLLALMLLQGTGSPPAAVQGFVKTATVSQEPLANARVELDEGPSAPLVTRTDVKGRFSFANLVPGRYRLKITKDGFIRQEYGERALDVPGPALRLTAAQPLDDIVILLNRAPTIIGHVTDEDGEPRPYVLLQAFRPGFNPRGNRLWFPAFSAQTDDLGEYRLYWMDPGEYILDATYRPELLEGENIPLGANVMGYPPTYYPGLQDPALAETFAISVGQEAHGIDFRFRRSRSVCIEVNVCSAITGCPFAGATVSLTRRGSVESLDIRRARTDGMGKASLGGITAGAYLLHVEGKPDDRQTALTRIQIPDSACDPRNPMVFRVTMDRGLQVNGRVSSEAVTPADIRNVRIGLTSVEPLVPSVEGAALQADGTFEIKPLLESQYLLTLYGLPGDLYMREAQLGNLNVLEDGLSFVGGESDPLNIVLGADGGSVTGSAADSAGRLSEGLQIVLIPDDQRLRRRPDRYRIITSGDDGSFTIRGIPPGEYRLFAWEYIPPYAYLNAEFMARYDAMGIPLQVIAGRNAPVRIQAIPARK